MESQVQANIRYEDIPAAFQVPDMAPSQFLLNGQIGEHIPQQREVFSPVILHGDQGSYPVRLGTAPVLNAGVALEALQAAESSYAGGMGQWAQMALTERIKHVQQFVEQCKPLEETMALLEMWEIAKPYQDCRNEFQRTMKYIEYSIEACKKLDHESDALYQIEQVLAQIRRCPLGLVLCMGPFNYPLNEAFALLIPALLMGNSVITKPHELGVLCTNWLLPAFAECFPPGVVNVIHGDGVELITPLMESGKLSALGFIGSSETANRIIQQHPRNNRLRTILGLEAKNPAFIFPDADLHHAAQQCLFGAFEFNGQRCTAMKHIWVHADIVDAFLSVLADEVEKIKCGMPWEEEVFITPLAETGKVAYLQSLVEDAKNKGAHIINKSGGKYADNLFYPTLLYPVSSVMEIYQVEQFGPVLPISSFRRTEDLTSYLIESAYGQQASIFTSSPQAAGALIDVLVNQVSRINLNARCQRSPDELPFTGRKDSAEGTLSIEDALRSFSIRSIVVAGEHGRELYFSILGKKTSSFLKI